MPKEIIKSWSILDVSYLAKAIDKSELTIKKAARMIETAKQTRHDLEIHLMQMRKQWREYQDTK